MLPRSTVIADVRENGHTRAFFCLDCQLAAHPRRVPTVLTYDLFGSDP